MKDETDALEENFGSHAFRQVALVAAMAHLLSRGVVVIRGAALETLCEVRRAVFDKTGTLTEGRPQVTQIHPLRAGLTRDRALALAGILEQAVHHPLARAFAAPTATTRSASAVRLVAGACFATGSAGFRRRAMAGRPPHYTRRWRIKLAPDGG